MIKPHLFSFQYQRFRINVIQSRHRSQAVKCCTAVILAQYWIGWLLYWIIRSLILSLSLSVCLSVFLPSCTHISHVGNLAGVGFAVCPSLLICVVITDWFTLRSTFLLTKQMNVNSPTCSGPWGRSLAQYSASKLFKNTAARSLQILSSPVQTLRAFGWFIGLIPISYIPTSLGLGNHLIWSFSVFEYYCSFMKRSRLIVIPGFYSPNEFTTRRRALERINSCPWNDDANGKVWCHTLNFHLCVNVMTVN